MKLRRLQYGESGDTPAVCTYSFIDESRVVQDVGKIQKDMGSKKKKTDENVSWMSKRGGVLMQGRSDINTASDFSSHRSAETALQSSDGEIGRKHAKSIDLVRDLL